MRKEFYLSKTFWINIVALVAIVLQSYTEFIITPEIQASILVIINLILRAITGDEISFGGKSFIK
jgi:hypothetical protein